MVEHVFAHQKVRFGLFIRTIGLARAEAKLTLAKIAYNFDRLVFHERRYAMGCLRPKGRKSNPDHADPVKKRSQVYPTLRSVPNSKGYCGCTSAASPADLISACCHT
jgi:hypothetical protein